MDGEGGRVGGTGGADGGRNSMVMVLSSDGLNGSVMLISFLFELERWKQSMKSAESSMRLGMSTHVYGKPTASS